MGTSSRRSGPAPGPDGLATAIDRRSDGRRLYLDNLKVVLIAAIIAIHGMLGYAGIVEVWTYTEAREVTLAPATELASSWRSARSDSS